MNTLLVAHGTRNPAGVAMIGDLATAMSERLGHRVRVAFVDVLGPTPSEVLAALPDDEPVAVVPAFLARGYHVRRDLPDHIAAVAHPNVRVSPALGPSPTLATALADRLREAGARPGDAVVLAAAGSSDARAVGDVEQMDRLLAAEWGAPVSLAFAAPSATNPAYPAVSEVVASARRASRRVAVASFLLADGLFQRRLATSGADVVATPLGLHPRVIDLACQRARSVARLSQTASR